MRSDLGMHSIIIICAATESVLILLAMTSVLNIAALSIRILIF